MKSHSILTLAIIALLVCTAAEAKYSGGAGEPNNPYQIANAGDLLVLAADANDYGKCFILTADVNLAGQVFTTAIIAADTNSTDKNQEFQGTAFTGTFDGNGHKISNLTITASTQDYIGLFGRVGSISQIRNLGVEDVNIIGRDYVGGLVGVNYGTLTGCYVTGSVSGTEFVGGLVGYNCHGGGSLTGCYATGSVSSSYKSVGGLVGLNSGSISQCYSTGTVSGDIWVGGLVGYNWGSISNCYSTGSVSGSQYVGGLVGFNYNSIGSYNSGSISQCYSTGVVSSSYSLGVGGLVGKNHGSVSGSFWDTQTSGQPTSDGGTGKTTEEMKTLSTFTSSGWDFVEIWGIGENQTYPYLRTEPAGDLNHDKKVDFADLAILALHWLEGTEP